MCIAGIFSESGQRERAETLFKQVKELAERSGQSVLKLVVMGVDGATAVWDGAFDKALEISQNILALSIYFNLAPIAGSLVQISAMVPLLRLGRAAEAARVLPGIPASLIKVICRAVPGQDPEAPGVLDNML